MKQLGSLYDYSDGQHIFIFSQQMGMAPALTVKDTDGSFLIAWDPQQAPTERDEFHILLHEVAHIATGAFYTVGTDLLEKRRLEQRANRWCIRFLIHPQELRLAMESGYTAPWELAEYFDLPEPLVHQAIAYYKSRGILSAALTPGEE